MKLSYLYCFYGNYKWNRPWVSVHIIYFTLLTKFNWQHPYRVVTLTLDRRVEQCTVSPLCARSIDFGKLGSSIRQIFVLALACISSVGHGWPIDYFTVSVLRTVQGAVIGIFKTVEIPAGHMSSEGIAIGAFTNLVWIYQSQKGDASKL